MNIAQSIQDAANARNLDMVGNGRGEDYVIRSCATKTYRDLCMALDARDAREAPTPRRRIRRYCESFLELVCE
jgi:hypothetical protein